MGQCSNCKHWKRELKGMFKTWGNCKKLSQSSDLEVMYNGEAIMYPQDIQINTHEDFSCKNWECVP